MSRYKGETLFLFNRPHLTTPYFNKIPEFQNQRRIILKTDGTKVTEVAHTVTTTYIFLSSI